MPFIGVIWSRWCLWRLLLRVRRRHRVLERRAPIVLVLVVVLEFGALSRRVALIFPDQGINSYDAQRGTVEDEYDDEDEGD